MSNKKVIGHHVIGSGSQGVIVLHGWLGDHTVFSPMFPYLNVHEFTYVFINYRGYGLSRNRTGDHTIAEISADAIGLADHMGFDKFHLIGHSMGGQVAQRVLVDATDRVLSAVCLTPVPASGVPLDADGQELFYGAHEYDEKRAQIISFTTSGRLSTNWIDWMVRCSREQTTPSAIDDYAHAWTKTDFSQEATGIKTPILVAVGEHDQAITVDIMRQTLCKFYSNVTLEVLANTGHYPMQETPVYLATLVESFMHKHRA